MIQASQTLRLKAGRAEAFDPVPGEVLRVLRGRLWVTQSGEREDHFVGPGQWLALGRGRVVIEADLGVTAVYERRHAARRRAGTLAAAPGLRHASLGRPPCGAGA